MSAMVEPFFYCLIASMIWAPVVFLATAHAKKRNAQLVEEKLWPTALAIAALPAMFAPFAAAFGISLRTAPVPPLMETTAPVVATTVEVAPTYVAPTSTISLAALLEATAALYFYGFLMFLALGVARHIWFAYRANYAFDIDDPELVAGLEEWRQRMGIRLQPRYAYSDVVGSVCVHGFFQPVILMPYNLLERVSLKDAILMGAHEMAHIKRGDTRLFAFCTAVKAIFWFNPFMQRLAARANLAAEQAADALVISSGVDRRRYAQCFVQGLRFAARVDSTAGRELVPSFTAFDKRSRRERLDAILSGNSSGAFLNMRGKLAIAASVAAASALAVAQAALAVAPPPAQSVLPQSPVDGEVTLPFGEQNKLLGKDRKVHEGVDIKARRGADVKAAGDGKVVAATSRYQGKRSWGKVIVIDHGHGLVTRYAHLDSLNVKKGDRVKAGDVIGGVGSTGVSSGPHLHFEVIQDGEHIDPAPVVAAPKPMPAPAPVTAVREARAAAPAIKPVPKVSPPSLEEKRTFMNPITMTGALTDRLAIIEDRVTEVFDDFEPLEGFEFEFEPFEIDMSDFDFDGFEDFQVMAMNSIEAVGDIDLMSAQDRERVREAQKDAMQAAGSAMREAKKEIERARQRAERDRERTQRQQQKAQRDFEKAQRDIEKAHAQLQRDRERVSEEIEQALEYAQQDVINQQEMLELREEALADVEADLEDQLEEIKRQRRALAREKHERRNKD